MHPAALPLLMHPAASPAGEHAPKALRASVATTASVHRSSAHPLVCVLRRVVLPGRRYEAATLYDSNESGN
eukprot:9058050-Pyramimonas_sp.AAC.1